MSSEQSAATADQHRAANSWRVAEVIAAHFETDASHEGAARTLRLRAPGLGSELAGQHIDIRLTAPDGYTAQRSYSLALAEGGDEAEITVEELADGEVSPYLVRGIAVGEQLEVRGPVGGWFVWHEEDDWPVVLIAGGSGVVPLMAMARRHRAVGSAARFIMLYSVRSPDRVIYGDELHELASDRAAPFDLMLFYTREAPPESTRPPGRLTRDEVATAAMDEDVRFFICGPTAFVETVANRLIDDGFDPDRIKTERFGG
ncbi:FAD-binding oxidoreductase [Gryllotalpicola protaetiae]|uniref:FAD-binding oxidoreductase n=1 Tax=Gryllotalpicola protaetiae TaxID=2419771 RepID=UPI0015E8C64F|nr:FAD-binding oxidoreductase [Gryllotalpicola protaetiae]